MQAYEPNTNRHNNNKQDLKNTVARSVKTRAGDEQKFKIATTLYISELYLYYRVAW
jgi:hypothetical protein